MTPDRRVLVFGDSIVAGVGDPEGRGWVGRVVAASFDAGLPLTAYPLGVRRETSVDVAARWRAEARPRLVAGADCRVVFAVGVNDATVEDGACRVEPDVSVATLAGMLDEAATLRMAALVVGPSPVCDPAQTERLRQLAERFRHACATRGVAFSASTTRSWQRGSGCARPRPATAPIPAPSATTRSRASSSPAAGWTGSRRQP